ncbi:MAG: SemiSWEET family transporter [Nanoarchaeota archaeon]
MSLLYILATVFGAVSGIANIPQVYKIFKRKSAKDISIITYSFLSLGAFIWVLYGIDIGNFPITITNILGGINMGLIIIGWFLYGRTKSK